MALARTISKGKNTGNTEGKEKSASVFSPHHKTWAANAKQATKPAASSPTADTNALKCDHIFNMPCTKCNGKKINCEECKGTGKVSKTCASIFGDKIVNKMNGNTDLGEKAIYYRCHMCSTKPAPKAKATKPAASPRNAKPAAQPTKVTADPGTFSENRQKKLGEASARKAAATPKPIEEGAAFKSWTNTSGRYTCMTKEGNRNCTLSACNKYIILDDAKDYAYNREKKFWCKKDKSGVYTIPYTA